MKFIHIFASDENDKFSSSYINFIEKNFSAEEHLIFIIGKTTIEEKESGCKVKKVSKDFYSLISLIKMMNKSEKIILHGLFSHYLILILFLQPWLLKKCYWVIWGGDLYNHENNKYTPKLQLALKNLRLLFKRFTIKRMKGLITYIDGTYDLALQLYAAKGKYFKCIMYPSNTYKDFEISTSTKQGGRINILIGSSAIPRNNHRYLFGKIKQTVKEEYNAICPLSYGEPDYKNEVIKQGKEILGRNFEPIINFMKHDDYVKFLNEVDVAIYGHKKNQAMGNIITLLGLGKKVYMRNDITSWETLEGLGIKLYAINLEPINNEFPPKIRKQNIKIVRKYFSSETLIMQWKKIFDD
jgi:dTDP-N-acetylfucosamine:lipid II N-acetylfucosaminyltransferase